MQLFCSQPFFFPVIFLSLLVYTYCYTGTRLPNFQQRPANIHVFVGSSFFLDCEADEITDRYYWTKGNDTLSSNDNIVVLPGRGLEVRNAQKNDSGTYYCVAVNEEGAVNASAVVSVTDTVITCDGKLIL